MIELIYDCDITMGLPGRDVDDGLAMLYLLGCPRVRLLGITSTFGNSDVEEVHGCLLSVLSDLGREHVPALRGASRDALRTDLSGGDADSRAESDAARFLADTVRERPGEVTVLATGSPTNLLGAYRLHPGFFAEVKQLVFMGGIVEPLLINGREMGELNFASDPLAAFHALYAGTPPAECDITVITGNLCLQALLTRERFDAFRAEYCGREKPRAERLAYLEEMVMPWFAWIERAYGLPGFHAWDATAALYLTNPRLFARRSVSLHSSLDDLRRGLLRIETIGDSAGLPRRDQRSGRINAPQRILDPERYWQTLFAAWASALENAN